MGAIAKITDDQEQLLAFYDFPAEHWVHLRTTNQIESTSWRYATEARSPRIRGSKAAGIAMAFKLVEGRPVPLARRQRAHLVALSRASATFKRGKLVERTTRTAQAEVDAAAKRHSHDLSSIGLDNCSWWWRRVVGEEEE